MDFLTLENQSLIIQSLPLQRFLLLSENNGLSYEKVFVHPGYLGDIRPPFLDEQQKIAEKISDPEADRLHTHYPCLGAGSYRRTNPFILALYSGIQMRDLSYLRNGCRGKSVQKQVGRFNDVQGS